MAVGEGLPGRVHLKAYTVGMSHILEEMALVPRRVQPDLAVPPDEEIWRDIGISVHTHRRRPAAKGTGQQRLDLGLAQSLLGLSHEAAK